MTIEFTPEDDRSSNFKEELTALRMILAKEGLQVVKDRCRSSAAEGRSKTIWRYADRFHPVALDIVAMLREEGLKANKPNGSGYITVEGW